MGLGLARAAKDADAAAHSQYQRLVLRRLARRIGERRAGERRQCNRPFAVERRRSAERRTASRRSDAVTNDNPHGSLDLVSEQDDERAV